MSTSCPRNFRMSTLCPRKFHVSTSCPLEIPNLIEDMEWTQSRLVKILKIMYLHWEVSMLKFYQKVGDSLKNSINQIQL